MNEIPPADQRVDVSRPNLPPGEPVRGVIPAVQVESSISPAPEEAPSKGCLEIFFEFIEWLCTSLCSCFKMDDSEVKRIIEEILELCKENTADTEYNLKSDKYITLYFDFPDEARQEINEIAIQYAACEFLRLTSKNREQSGETFLQLTLRHHGQLTQWIRQDEGRAAKAARELLNKNGVYYYALDTIFETYALKLKSRAND